MPWQFYDQQARMLGLHSASHSSVSTLNWECARIRDNSQVQHPSSEIWTFYSRLHASFSAQKLSVASGTWRRSNSPKTECDSWQKTILWVWQCTVLRTINAAIGASSPLTETHDKATLHKTQKYPKLYPSNPTVNVELTFDIKTTRTQRKSRSITLIIIWKREPWKGGLSHHVPGTHALCNIPLLNRSQKLTHGISVWCRACHKDNIKFCHPFPSKNGFLLWSAIIRNTSHVVLS